MKEQSEKLFRAIGDVGDDLIARADAPVKKAPRVWVKWAALAACCALVIGAAAFVVPMFHAGSTAPETASAPMAAPAPTADTAALESPAEEEMSLEAAEAPAEPMAEAAPAEAEPAEQKTRTLPGAASYIAGGSYYVLDAAGVCETVNACCNPYEQAVAVSNLYIRVG